MGFHKFILDYLQKRKAEREAKGKSLRGLLVLLFAAIGSLVGVSCGLSLPLLGLSIGACLPLTILLTSIFTLSGITVANLLFWPWMQRLLAENDDNFNYKLYLEDELENKLEKIRKSKVSKEKKVAWEEQAYQHYFEELRKNEEQINLTRNRIRDQKRIAEELYHLRQELSIALDEVKELAVKAKKIEEEVTAKELAAKSKALNPASTDTVSSLMSQTSKREQQPVEARTDKNQS